MSDNWDRDNNGDYDQNFAQDAGYAAGAVGEYRLDLSKNVPTLILTVEGEYDRQRDDFRRGEQNMENNFQQSEQNFENRVQRDEQAVENAPENAARWAEQGVDNVVQGVEDIPSDIGGAINKVAGWFGEKIGGVEREGRDAEQDVDRFGQGIANDYNEGRQDVDRFGEGVQNSYDQGENEGRRDDW